MVSRQRSFKDIFQQSRVWSLTGRGFWAKDIMKECSGTKNFGELVTELPTTSHRHKQEGLAKGVSFSDADP
jgi:hypothetical protein